MATFISNSPAETIALGESWGRDAKSGLVIALSGDLGAGKTQLTKGIARGLGITDRVHSPTFALLNEYHGGRLPLFHLDLYRLETPDQIIGAGLEEYFHPAGVSVIEWAERWFLGTDDLRAQVVKGTHLRQVRLEALTETERRIIYEDFGN
jgi:tRNA threonylcarbamoyladenosine biosynthesis protein TsaE